MNIHDTQRYGPRKKGQKPQKTSEAPRTRTGQNFPGGKQLRRALAALSIRQNTYAPTAKPSGHAMTKPGSMRGNV